ncbi:MAG: methylmalonyl-CoA mutase family protein [Microthrixaceae bacterium]
MSETETNLKHHVRFITAASLFDGHDASINIMRRILQSQGVEVIHLGHNRSVDEVVRAAVAEDVQGIALSSYQGGHVEYFTYLVERLAQEGAGQVKVFGGGGGVIIDSEITQLADIGVQIFSPDDGQRLGLVGMIASIVDECDFDPGAAPPDIQGLGSGSHRDLARTITCIENASIDESTLSKLRRLGSESGAPVLGITGTGGAGKSSLTDELVHRFRMDSSDDLRIAVIAIDPTRRRGGGALLGDRIRMNSIETDSIFFRSLATRSNQTEVPQILDDVICAARVWGAELVIIETPGIGQGDAAIVPYADVSAYVMTPEFGAASQLEKIDMLDFADAVAINKFERRGARDALRDVARQLVRNREAFGMSPEDMPVFGTVASRFNDDGVTALYQFLRSELEGHGLKVSATILSTVTTRTSTLKGEIIPSTNARYLAEIAQTVRTFHATTNRVAELAERIEALEVAASEFVTIEVDGDASTGSMLRDRADRLRSQQSSDDVELLRSWDARRSELSGDDRPSRESLSGTSIPKLALPRFSGAGDTLRWLRSENLPGSFPFTAGVFPFKRENEDPARMFAGEGGPGRTNRRFHMLAAGQPATRLSTAFDSVTLYGRDPAVRPDIFGKIGNSGVSIATLDDMRELYSGFDLCDPDDVGLHDHQRAGPCCARDVSQHSHRPADWMPIWNSTAVSQARMNSGPSAPRSSHQFEEPFRPTSSKRIRGRTPASSRPSSLSA